MTFDVKLIVLSTLANIFKVKDEASAGLKIAENRTSSTCKVAAVKLALHVIHATGSAPLHCGCMPLYNFVSAAPHAEDVYAQHGGNHHCPGNDVFALEHKQN